MTPRESELDLPASVGGSLVEVWVGGGLDREKGSSNPGRCPLEVTVNPTTEPRTRHLRPNNRGGSTTPPLRG